MTDALRIRPPAVAGAFYPADPAALERLIDASIADAVSPPPDGADPTALVVPHAGYVYSGPIAASAYLRLGSRRDRIRRVVLLGPSHHALVPGMALSGADVWRTPLGDVALDTEARDRLLALPRVDVDDAAHAPEHCLEVQVPFLQRVLGDIALVPVLVGDATAEEVAAVVESFWADPETLVVVSTDLSHYHAYREAQALDERTAVAIVARRPDDIDRLDACGARPLRGLLRAAADADRTVEQLDLRNSGDTAGDRTRVVGYGAFAVA